MALGVASSELHAADPAELPNILIILADDLGYSDLGCYGGDVETPNLDQLASNGLRFSQFYNTARCWPSRAAIMTGLYPHQAHLAMNYGPNAPPAYSGLVPQTARMIPELLAGAGYRSYHAGKWHLDTGGPERKNTLPLARGFEHSYAVMGHNNFFFPGLCLDENEEVRDFPPDYYVTDAVTDKMVGYLKGHAAEHSEQPFFGYLAYTSPHFPLHAREADVAHYLGRFRDGWDAMRERRLTRLKANGLVDCDLSPRDPDAKPWDEFTDDEKTAWDARMAVHAAMITCMDRGIGRVLDQIRAMQALDNTLVLFMSDNGASAEFIVRGEGDDPAAPPGSRKSFKCIEVGWANAANTPFRMHKIWTHEGGVSTPLIAHWPKGIAAKNEVRHDVGHLIDLMPTVLEIAGQTYPKEFEGQPTTPLPGHSLAALFKGESRPAPEFLFWEHQGNRAYREGDWKIVSAFPGTWELYNVKDDRAETKNLIEAEPDRAKAMIAKWQAYADKTGVVDWASLPQSKGRPSAEYRMK
jgi:arylsulfatase